MVTNSLEKGRIPELTPFRTKSAAKGVLFRNLTVTVFKAVLRRIKTLDGLTRESYYFTIRTWKLKNQLYGGVYRKILAEAKLAWKVWLYTDWNQSRKYILATFQRGKKLWYICYMD